MREHDIRDGKRRMENKYMLDAMVIESRRWPKLGELDKTISTNIILPQTILNYHEYQSKLQRLAFYAEQGDNEAMQSILDKEEFNKKKNSFLQPIYRDLKAAISHMTFTPEYKLMREYIRNRTLILNAVPEGSEKADKGLRELKNSYAKLLKNEKTRLQNDPGLRLRVTLKRVEDIFQLLNLW